MIRRVRSFVSVAAGVIALAASPAAATDWPTLMQNAQRNGYVADARMSSAVAPKLGVRWMTNLYSADLGSPVAAYDPVLHKTVVYVGDERGDVRALDEADGSTIWSVSLGPGAAPRDTPLVWNGAVWVGTSYGTRIVKLDASTGAILCSLPGPASFFASPLGVSVGGTKMVYASTIDEPAFAGPLYGINATSCKTAFTFTDFVTVSGAWASPAFAVDALGRSVVITGSADPDSREYSIDALTGARYWSFAAFNPPPGTYDIGAAADIAPPGTNGFRGGVAYVPTKYGIMVALNLTTGKPYWTFNFNRAAHATEGGLSTPALVRDELVFGYNGGVFRLNATSGKPIWQWRDPTGTEVLASPAVVGPPGKEVVAIADLAGAFRVLALSNGQQLYAYQTHGYMDASAAYVNGHFIDVSSDGFVYDFGPGGGNAGTPRTALHYPATNQTLANGDGTIVLWGTANDAAGVKAVNVAVQAGGAYGPWYDAATASWVTGAVSNPAQVAFGPHGDEANWKLKLPVPPQGGTFTVYANAVDAANLADVAGVNAPFTVTPNRRAPMLSLAPAIAAPGSTVTANGSGFAAGEPVTFALGGAPVVAETASPSGTVGPAVFDVPLASAFGTTPVTATGGTSGAVATAALDVANAWTQAGHDASRTGFEAHDDAFHAIVHIGPNLYLKQAWYAAAGAPVETSPAIVNGLAYFGNDAGTMRAVATQNSVPVWSYTVPSGAAIRSSPAIDSGLAIFGADDGMLYRLSAATGAPSTPTNLGGKLLSPAVTGGAIYVASRDGRLFDVDEGTGGLRWAVTGTAATAASPALDAAASLAVVCDYGGHVTAYDAATGERRWRTYVGGALKGSPLIDTGTVYVGSTNGSLFALDEHTGAIVWTYAEGSPIEATPAIARGDTFFGFKGDSVFVGADDGTVTALDAGTQKPVWKIGFGAPVTGLAATLGDLVFFELANGAVGASRGPEFSDHLWTFRTGAALDTSPAVNDGAVYVGAGDGGLYAFTAFGNAPNAVRRAGTRRGTP